MASSELLRQCANHSFAAVGKCVERLLGTRRNARRRSANRSHARAAGSADCSNARAAGCGTPLMCCSACRQYNALQIFTACSPDIGEMQATLGRSLATP